MRTSTWRGDVVDSDSDDSDEHLDRSNLLLHGASSTARAAVRGGGGIFAASGAAATRDDRQEDLENKVYRPLLFHSNGYASSELFRDTYEMRARMQERLAASPSSALLAVDDSDDDDGDRAKKKKKQDNGDMIHPRIRLETLSSRAATTVLWITYLSFCLAFAMPYLQSRGFLGTVVTLPGGICDDRVVQHEPCIFVDKKKGIARWSGFVSNVSWYAGSIEVSLDISEVINSTSPGQQGDDGLREMDELWRGWRPHASTMAENATSLEIVDQSFALQYDVILYGIDTDTIPFSKKQIAAERNQSVWVNCPSKACEKVKLLEISQDFEGRVRQTGDLTLALVTVVVGAGLEMILMVLVCLGRQRIRLVPGHRGLQRRVPKCFRKESVVRFLVHVSNTCTSLLFSLHPPVDAVGLY